MKVIITGPVNTDKYFGGVATFTEGIADGFKEKGYDVEIVTDYSNKNFTTNGVKIISFSKQIARKNIFVHKQIKQYIEENNTSLVISSLEYGLSNLFLKKSIKTVHYLHAFPSVKRSFCNNFFVKNITKLIANNSTSVISNSGLTSTINSEIYNIKSDNIINVALGYEFLNEIKSLENKKVCSNDISRKKVVYIGRLVKEKNIDNIIKAFSKLNKEEYSLFIIGDGPEQENLHDLAKRLSIDVSFINGVSQKKVVEYYLDADIFVSLNPHEPYGIVYLEALTTNTKIVCPKTGGQMDTLVNYKDRVEFINPYNIEDIAKGIVRSSMGEVSPLTEEFIHSEFSYKKVVDQIETLYLEEKNICKI